MKKDEKGFTLLELLISVAITGILSTATIVPLTGALDGAADTRMLVDIKNISKALEYDRGIKQDYQATAEMPISISSFLTTVPKNNNTDNKRYEWVSNVLDTELFCVWATLKKGNEDGDMFYVANRFGSGYSDTEPTNIVDCEYFKSQYDPNSGHDVDDNDDINPVIVNPKKDKVLMCHNPGSKQKEKLIQRQAISSHQAHGDYIGPCL